MTILMFAQLLNPAINIEQPEDVLEYMPVKNEVWNFLSIVYKVYLTLESSQIYTLAPSPTSQALLWQGEEKTGISEHYRRSKNNRCEKMLCPWDKYRCAPTQFPVLYTWIIFLSSPFSFHADLSRKSNLLRIRINLYSVILGLLLHFLFQIHRSYRSKAIKVLGSCSVV